MRGRDYWETQRSVAKSGSTFTMDVVHAQKAGSNLLPFGEAYPPLLLTFLLEDFLKSFDSV